MSRRDQRIAAAVMKHHGEEGGGVFKPLGGTAVSVQVQLRRNVELVGEYGQVVDHRTEATLLKSEVGTVRRDDALVVGTESWTVDQVVSDTGYLVRVAVK